MKVSVIIFKAVLHDLSKMMKKIKSKEEKGPINPKYSMKSTG